MRVVLFLFYFFRFPKGEHGKNGWMEDFFLLYDKKGVLK